MFSVTSQSGKITTKHQRNAFLLNDAFGEDNDPCARSKLNITHSLVHHFSAPFKLPTLFMSIWKKNFTTLIFRKYGAQSGGSGCGQKPCCHINVFGVGVAWRNLYEIFTKNMNECMTDCREFPKYTRPVLFYHGMIHRNYHSSPCRRWELSDRSIF